MKAVRDKDDRIITTKRREKATRWHEYFEELLNNKLPKSPVPKWDVHIGEQRVDNISIDETIRAYRHTAYRTIA